MATATETAMVMATETGTETGTETETATETATETGTGTAMAMATETATQTSRVGLLLVATTLLASCATVDSESGVDRACPTLVHYGTEFRERAAGEVELLAEDSAIVEMLSHYAAMREQTRACRRGETVQ